MPEPKELYVSNLTETLRQSQRYMTIGFGASVFFGLVVFAASLEGKEVRAPIGPVEVLVSQNTALALSVAVYWVAGLLATFFIARIASIISLLGDSDLVIAALMYPSVLTTRPYAGRFGACFLPPLLVVIGMVRIFGMRLWGWGILGLFLLVVPYLQLGLDLRHPIGDDVIKDRAVKLVLKYFETSKLPEPSSCSVEDVIKDSVCKVKTVTNGVVAHYLVPNVGTRVIEFHEGGDG